MKAIDIGHWIEDEYRDHVHHDFRDREAWRMSGRKVVIPRRIDTEVVIALEEQYVPDGSMGRPRTSDRRDLLWWWPCKR